MTGARWSFVALAVSTACSAPAAPGPEAHDALPRSASGRAQTIRMEIPTAPGPADLPRLMLRDALQQAGYTIESYEYRDSTTTVQALLAGELDVADLPFMQIVAAIQRGAAIAPIVSRGGRERVLVSAPKIKTCADLNHQQVSLPTLNSTQALSFQRYIDTRCPGTQVELLVIPRVENRMTGLLSHSTGAALLDFASMLRLQREAGGIYNVLSVFSVDFPELIEGTATGARAFLDRYPDTARDIIRELILAMRKIQDPAVLQHQVETRLGLEPEEAALLTRTYLENKVWDVNGALSPERVQANIDFAVKMNIIQPGMTIAQAADLSFLDTVLADLGRQ